MGCSIFRITRERFIVLELGEKDCISIICPFQLEIKRTPHVNYNNYKIVKTKDISVSCAKLDGPNIFFHRIELTIKNWVSCLVFTQPFSDRLPLRARSKDPSRKFCFLPRGVSKGSLSGANQYRVYYLQAFVSLKI